jgi:Zn-dependent peptidase ImmA (M78 family)
MERLLEIVSIEGIHLRYTDLRPIGNIQGIYIAHSRAGPVILLDKFLLFKPRDQRCILAHEIGHHFNPPRSGLIAFHRNNLFSDDIKQITIRQDESKALRWGTSKLMPTDDVWAAIRSSYDTVPLLAEYFYVTEWFVRAKIGFIRVEEREQGVRLKWRDIIKKTTQTSPNSGLCI